MAESKSKKPLDKFTILAVVLIALAILYFVYSFFMGIKAPTSAVNAGLGQFRTVNISAMDAIKGLNACGSWPLAAVGLNAGRENPFSKESAAAPQMAAVASVICLPPAQ